MLADEEYGYLGRSERCFDLVSPLRSRTELLVIPDIDKTIPDYRSEHGLELFVKFLVLVAVADEDLVPVRFCKWSFDYGHFVDSHFIVRSGAGINGCQRRRRRHRRAQRLSPLVFLDDDDLLEPEHVALCLAAAHSRAAM